jgi:hypothetical protein
MNQCTSGHCEIVASLIGRGKVSYSSIWITDRSVIQDAGRQGLKRGGEVTVAIVHSNSKQRQASFISWGELSGFQGSSLPLPISAIIVHEQASEKSVLHVAPRGYSSFQKMQPGVRPVNCGEPVLGSRRGYPHIFFAISTIPNQTKHTKNAEMG